MKKPDDKTMHDAKADPAADDTGDTGRKMPAEPGTLKNEISAPAQTTPFQPSAEPVKPSTSGLVGDGSASVPAAPRKTGTSATASASSQVSAISRPADAVASSKPADIDPHKDKPSDTTTQPEPKGALKDVPPEAILRDTPKGSPAPVQNVTVKKTGFWPVVLGGAVAAGIGAGATLWALPHLPSEWLPPAEAVPVAVDADADAIRSDAVAAGQAAARDAVASLRDDLATASPQAPAQDPQELAALRSQLQDQAAQIADLAARPQIDPALAERVQTIATQAGALEQQIQSAAEQAQQKITAAQAQAETMQAEAEETTRRASAVVAVAELQSALDRGVTPDQARETLDGAGIDTPDALTRDVPSLAVLQGGFADASRSALRASLARGSASGSGNLFGNFLRAQTGARSVEPREGDDPDAVLSRADRAVIEGRIADALSEIDALPDAGKSAPSMSDWLDDARAYRDAKAALNDLSAHSN